MISEQDEPCCLRIEDPKPPAAWKAYTLVPGNVMFGEAKKVFYGMADAPVFCEPATVQPEGLVKIRQDQPACDIHFLRPFSQRNE